MLTYCSKWSKLLKQWCCRGIFVMKSSHYKLPLRVCGMLKLMLMLACLVWSSPPTWTLWPFIFVKCYLWLYSTKYLINNVGKLWKFSNLNWQMCARLLDLALAEVSETVPSWSHNYFWQMDYDWMNTDCPSEGGCHFGNILITFPFTWSSCSTKSNIRVKFGHRLPTHCIKNHFVSIWPVDEWKVMKKI